MLMTTPFVFAQRQIALSIDDVPGVNVQSSDGSASRLLLRLDSLHIPVCIFINEKNEESINAATGHSALEQWIARDYMTIGNHSYSHPDLSKVGTKAFLDNVDRGAVLCTNLAKKYHKDFHYFRFPYNDCGVDSLQQDTMRRALQERGYSIAPFSLESADYAYNDVYVHRWQLGDSVGARAVAQSYLHYTVAILLFIDSVATANGSSNLRHIYLCHDNALNRDYLPELVRHIQDLGFRFVSFDSAVQDPGYHRPLAYHGRGGMSWIYRWMHSPQRRLAMIAEPGDIDILHEYQSLQAAKEKSK